LYNNIILIDMGIDFRRDGGGITRDRYYKWYPEVDF